MDYIIIHGSPGCGKTTIATKLHERLKSPWFEFGWIPEFRNLNPYTNISCYDEEQISFENLMLVCNNYKTHGFQNVILTDLNDKRMLDVSQEFRDDRYIICTLYSDSNELIVNRIKSRDNGNSYKNYEQALKINNLVKKRSPLPNEYRFLCSNTPDSIVNAIIEMLNKQKHDSSFDINNVNKEDYFDYTVD